MLILVGGSRFNLGVAFWHWELGICSHPIRAVIHLVSTDANSPTTKEGKHMENGVLVNEASGKEVMRYGSFLDLH